MSEDAAALRQSGRTNTGVRSAVDDVLAGGRTTPVALPRWLIGPGATALVASLTTYLLTARLLGINGFDLSVYLLGGEAYRHGRDIYQQRLQDWPFTYPPVTVLVFGPLSVLPTSTVLWATVAANIAAVGVVIWLAFRMLGHRRGLGLLGATLAITAAVVWIEPIYGTLAEGQVNIALMLLVLADFALAGRRRWPTGVLVGVATAVKLVPGLFIGYLLLTRRYRAAITAAATALGLTLLGFAAAWSDSRRFWFGGVFADPTRAAGPDGIASPYNQSLRGVAVRLFGSGAGTSVWYALAIIVLVAGLAVAVAARRAGDEVAGLLTCAVTALLVSPLSWHEHWVWVVPALVWLVDLGRRGHASVPILAGTLPCLLWLAFLVVPRRGTLPGQIVPDSPLSSIHHAWSTGHHGLLVIAASAEYPIIGLALLLGAGWLFWVRRGRAHHQVTVVDSPDITRHPDRPID